MTNKDKNFFNQNSYDIQLQKLKSFQHEYHKKSLKILNNEVPGNILDGILNLAYDECGSFFPKQLSEDAPNFASVLIYKYPKIMTSAFFSRFITANENHETSVAVFMEDIFFKLMLQESLMLGVNRGIFKETEHYFDVRPFRDEPIIKLRHFEF